MITNFGVDSGDTDPGRSRGERAGRHARLGGGLACGCCDAITSSVFCADTPGGRGLCWTARAAAMRAGRPKLAHPVTGVAGGGHRGSTWVPRRTRWRRPRRTARSPPEAAPDRCPRRRDRRPPAPSWRPTARIDAVSIAAVLFRVDDLALVDGLRPIAMVDGDLAGLGLFGYRDL